MTTVSYNPQNLTLVGSDTWDRVVYKIQRSAAVQKLGVDYLENLSDRIFDQTLSFLVCCGTHEQNEGTFSANAYVDEGWHSFLLHLKPYIDFCNNNFGKIIWHNPFNPQLDADSQINLEAGQERAKLAMAKRNLYIDEAVWSLPYEGTSALGNCDDACSWAYLG